MRLMLLARSLGVGGAERQLMLLARELQGRHELSVVTFYGGESSYTTQPWLTTVWSPLHKRGRWDLVFVLRYWRKLREMQPDVVYAFTGPPSLLALVSRLRRRGPAVVWGIRSSDVDLRHYGLLARLVRWMECRLAAFADGVIANSEAGRSQALREGFARRDIRVIVNGIDTEAFAPVPHAAQALRRRIGLPDDAMLIGTVARLDPMKGYDVLIQAASLLHARRPSVHWVLAGGGDARYSHSLQELARDLGLDGVVHWLGPASEVSTLHSAFDLYTSASVFGEGFSNSIGEAMACGTPCVVTDVGDSAGIVGDTGRVVPARDAAALAAAWAELLDLPRADRQALGRRARSRVEEHFSVARMVTATEDALQAVRLTCGSRS